MTNLAIFEGDKSSNDIIINDTMSDDEVVASDVPLRYLFSLASNTFILILTCFFFLVKNKHESS